MLRVPNAAAVLQAASLFDPRAYRDELTTELTADMVQASNTCMPGFLSAFAAVPH